VKWPECQDGPDQEKVVKKITKLVAVAVATLYKYIASYLMVKPTTG
jgi:hypothetical protein